MSPNLSDCSEETVRVPMPWRDVHHSELETIQGVCLDIDDTLSTGGKLTAEAYSSLWELREAGFAVVPVTGRPAGWCDHFARFWPIHAVVGENGAFTFFMENGVRKKIETPTLMGTDNKKNLEKLLKLRQKIKKKFPQAQWASDQTYREYDLAVDICEDVPAWSLEEVSRLLKFCSDDGAHAKLSSIHVNIWYGDYDKKTGFEYWLSQGTPGWTGKKLTPKNWLYIGDSPNDEPMFHHFSYSVGVANLAKYINQLKYPPLWMTERESGLGFVEMSRKLIHMKSK